MNLLRRGIISSGDRFDLSSVFANSLYTGLNAIPQTITSDLDFINKSGLAWIKARSLSGATANHILTDTIRGAGEYLESNTSDAETTNITTVSQFNADGFDVGTNSAVNSNTQTYAAWQFMKEEGFFDILVVNKTSSVESFLHELGIEVGHATVKSLGVDDWYDWHKGMASDKYLKLNASDAENAVSAPNRWDNTSPTSTNITLGSDFANGNYVIYLWAHNPDKGIACGSYTGTATPQAVNTGFPSGWVMPKNSTTAATDWWIQDVKRGLTAGVDPLLRANLDAAETNQDYISSHNNGFTLTSDANVNALGDIFRYITIADPAQF